MEKHDKKQDIMKEPNNEETYLKLLDDCLVQKKKLLRQLIEETDRQSVLLQAEQLDFNALNQTISAKEPLITKLLQIDDGFQTVYDRVKEDLQRIRLMHRTQIQAIQKKIEEITKLSVHLQALEQQNHNRMEMVLSTQKQGIKKFKVSSKTANLYYKNMAKINQVEPSFIDKKQ